MVPFPPSQAHINSPQGTPSKGLSSGPLADCVPPGHPPDFIFLAARRAPQPSCRCEQRAVRPGWRWSRIPFIAALSPSLPISPCSYLPSSVSFLCLSLSVHLPQEPPLCSWSCRWGPECHLPFRRTWLRTYPFAPCESPAAGQLPPRALFWEVTSVRSTQCDVLCAAQVPLWLWPVDVVRQPFPNVILTTAVCVYLQ